MGVVSNKKGDRKCFAVRKLVHCPEDLGLFASVLMQPHVFWNVDFMFRDVVRLHYFFNDLASGIWHIYAAFDSSNEFLGCVLGNVSGVTFFAHLFFFRGVDVLSCLNEVSNRIKEDLHTTAWEGDIPESCRAAQIVARRFGCKDIGLIDGVKCLRGNPPKYTEVRRFRKED